MAPISPFAPVVLSHPRLPITAHVIPFGLNVTRLVFQNPSSGETHDVIAGPEEPSDHWQQGRKFLGPLVGRYANRLPAGKCLFPGGELDLPEFSGPGVCLHGGPAVQTQLKDIAEGSVPVQDGPLDQLVWTKISSMQSQFFGIESPSSPASASAKFAVISAAGSNGFPGTVRIEARLGIQPPASASVGGDNGPMGRSAGVLRVEYRAQIIDDCEATPLNITNHWGFNLSASDSSARQAEHGTTDDHTLRIMAVNGESPLYTLGLDDKMLPTGELIACNDGGEHDWLQEGTDGLGRPIRQAMTASGYDHFYAWGPASDEEAMQPRLILHSNSTQLSLSFRTNQTGTQFYHATGQPDAPAPPESSGGKKKTLHEADPASPSGNAKRSAVVLEFAQPHATFLHKEYQALIKDDTVLHQNQRYRNWVEVELYKN